ncbi:hypothetical protein EWM64_g5983 [Hericium alpestre]|uniref:DNA polymerase delta subunit 3 n=1 Tax=Hericium alpestre TaxID=135208 RepID=A0A4Y9ZVV6_9AGAM|nr:hypothetical protein EWM64_g5983 [Hericium alpestre]
MSSTKAVTDYLTKKLIVEKSIVTYRLLSRELAIHVNDAKTVLAEFHANAKGQGDTVFATYLISGEARPQGGDEMEVDEDEDTGDDVVETTVMLAGETELENTKGTFYRVFAVHVYSLSPSPIRDANLVCTPTPDLRKVEADKGPEFALVVGRVVGPHVKLRGKLTRPKVTITAGAAASSSKHKLPGLAKPPLKPAKEEKKVAVKAESKDEKPKAKSKATGKLDFAKAKPKEVKREETKESILAEKPTAKEKKAQETKKAEAKRGLKRKSAIQVSDSEEEPEVEKPKPPPKEKKAEETKKGQPKRGLKRKSTIQVSDSEDEPAPAAVKPPPAKPARRSKPVVVSDDEEESDVPPVRKAKGKAKASPADSDADSRNAELKAMMDVDDEHVIKVSRSASEAHKEETEEDVEMEDAEEPEPVPKAKPKKATKKKVVPVGSIGLKKKRVVKSRSRMDDKGYFVTEDYSSYESVDEEEPEPAPAKGKGKKAAAAKKAAETESEAEAKPKPVKEAAESKAASKKKNGAGAKAATGQMDLKSWFAKPKK